MIGAIKVNILKMSKISKISWYFRLKNHDTIIVDIVTIRGLVCGANLWFGGFPYPVNPGRPEWSKVQTRGKPLVATAQAKYMSADER